MRDNYDVVVVGGGTAGVVAALQAARAGAQTLLIEQSARFGGTMTNANIPFPGLFHAWGRQIIAGIGWELVTRCVQESGGTLQDFSVPPAHHWRHQVRLNGPLYALLCAESLQQAGVAITLHSMIASVKESSECVHLTICTRRGLQSLTATILIDCTGDASALALAGCPRQGTEEPQPATICSLAQGYDFKKLDMDAINKAADEAIARGELKSTDGCWQATQANFSQWLSGYGNNANHLSIFNSADSEERTALELSGCASTLRLLRFLRKQPGLEGINLSYLSPECGVRETMRIQGLDTITVEDYITGKVWPDALGYSFYPIDLHTHKEGGLDYRKLKEGVFPTFGFGALRPTGSDRLLTAGRCLSCDRLANSALRVQATCMATGQAAGAAAALAAKGSTTLSGIALPALRNLLKQHQAILPDV